MSQPCRAQSKNRAGDAHAYAGAGSSGHRLIHLLWRGNHRPATPSRDHAQSCGSAVCGPAGGGDCVRRVFLPATNGSADSRGASRLPPNWKLLYCYALLGALVHLFQDFTNNYGVRPFAPFNEKWYAWDIVFIIDPVMLVALLLALTLPALMALVTEEISSAKPQFRGRGAAIFALLCLAAVMLVRDFEHRRAVNALNERTYRDQEPLRVSAFPQMLNPFAWNGVVETRDFFQLLPVDSGSGEIDPLNSGVMRFKPEETPVTLAAKTSRLGRVYLDWARYPLVTVQQMEGGRNQVQFEDLRFESAEGLAQRRGPPLASYVV